MPKYRKMLTDYQAPYIQQTFRLIETQSLLTIAKWCVGYAEERLLPIYESVTDGDFRPRSAINVAQGWIEGDIKLKEAKEVIKECTAAARGAEGEAVAQTAARAIGACAGTIYNPTLSAGLLFYGALAVSYHELGIEVEWERLLKGAEAECWRIKAALENIAVDNEPEPVKVNWGC